MTVESTASTISYRGNGATTAFPTTFEFAGAAHIVVELTDATGTITTKTLTTDYNVTGGSGAAGTVTMAVAPATGETLVIYRDTERTQGTDLVNNTAMQAEVVEAALDKLTRMVQEVVREAQRSVKLLRTTAAANGIALPDPVNGQVLVGNATGSAWENRSIGDLSRSVVALPLLVSDGGTGGATPATGRAGLGTALSDTGTEAASFTVEASDAGKAFLCNSILGDITVALPAAAVAGDGFSLTIKKTVAANSVTIAPNGSETIDGDATSRLVAAHAAVTLWCDGRAWHRAAVIADAALPRGYLSGLRLSNNKTDRDHDIDIAIGACRDDANASNMALAVAITKRIDAAWMAGDGNGGLDTGSLDGSSWYHVYLISDGATVDALFSTSPSAPALPSGYAARRRIGSVLTDGSATIRGFTQYGNEVFWDRPPADEALTRTTTAAVLVTLSVPPGLAVKAHIYARIGDNNAYFSSPDADDVAVSRNAPPFGIGESYGGTATGLGLPVSVWTDSSGRIRRRYEGPRRSHIATLGWMDPTL